MNAVALGPFVFDAVRLSAIVGIIVFAVVGSILAHRSSPRLSGWTTATILSGIVGARAWHVGAHIGSFTEEPWRILAIWQGGFSIAGAFIGTALGFAWLFIRSRNDVPKAITALAMGLLSWFAVTYLTQQGPGPPAPTEAYRTIDEEASVVIAARAGRPLVLNLWASWCPPCRREMPMMAQMERQHPDVDFIFANQGEQLQAIKIYLTKSGVDLQTVLLDPSMALSKRYAAVGLPATLIIRADGTLAGTHLGEISKETLLEAISALTSEPD